MGQYLHGEAIQSAFNKDGDSLDKLETNSSSGFECNICLDLVQDPVVTLCGHLYCWPCIYRWISFHDENPDHQQPQCPVCKGEMSMRTLIPLYGRGQSSSKNESSNLGHIPQRPSSPRCGINTSRSNRAYPVQPLQNRGYARPYQPGNYAAPSMSGSTMHLVDPMIGMFGEMVYARFFGNSQTTLFTYPNSYHLEGSNNPRLRRHMMQNDKSLSRICFFLCCCVMLCLILF